MQTSAGSGIDSSKSRLGNYREARLRRFCYATLLGIALALCLTEVSTTSSDSFFARGDFPAFYSAALLGASGDGEALYDIEQHRKIQNEHWPSLNGAVLPYAYPPWFALFLAPVSYLSAMQAKLIFTFLQVIVLALSVVLFLRSLCHEPWFEELGRQAYFGSQSTLRLLIFTFALCFAPLLCGTIAGQNTALSLLAFASIFFCLSKGGRIPEVVAGISAGLWLFKPHFAIPAIILLLLLRRYYAVTSAALIALLSLTLAISFFGMGVIEVWIANLGLFSQGEFQVNRHQIISLLPSTGDLNLSGLFAVLYYLAASALSAVLAYILGAYILGAHVLGRKTSQDSLEVERYALLLFTPLLVLLSTHTMFYDLGLCFLGFCFVFLRGYASSSRTEKFLWAGLLALSFVLGASRASFAFSPFVAYPILLVGIIIFSTEFPSSRGLLRQESEQTS